MVSPILSFSDQECERTANAGINKCIVSIKVLDLTTIPRGDLPADHHQFLISSHTPCKLNTSLQVSPNNMEGNLSVIDYVEDTGTLKTRNVTLGFPYALHLLTLPSMTHWVGDSNDDHEDLKTLRHIPPSTVLDGRRNFFVVTAVPTRFNEHDVYILSLCVDDEPANVKSNDPRPCSSVSMEPVMKLLGTTVNDNASPKFTAIQGLFTLHTTSEPSDLSIIVLEEKGPHLLQLSGCKRDARSVITFHCDTTQGAECISGAADPHHQPLFTVAARHGLRTFDSRAHRGPQAQCAWDSYHIQRCIDYNPNREYEIATGGEDGSLRFWDTRRMEIPRTIVRNLHSHWITHSMYNVYYDLVMATSGTDSAINLWRIDSLVSTTLPPRNGNTERHSIWQHPTMAYTSNVHDDTVCGLCWSDSDPWIFASIGYDNKFAVHQVPYEERYKVLV